jgi:hypothetical protein
MAVIREDSPADDGPVDSGWAPDPGFFSMLDGAASERLARAQLLGKLLYRSRPVDAADQDRGDFKQSRSWS